jgi:hypothetical protein
MVAGFGRNTHMGAKSSDYPYNVLRREGVIQPLKRGKPKKIDLPVELAEVFTQKKFSFSKWCNFWKFSTEEAQVALQEGNILGATDSVLGIHRAFKRDFPDRYTMLFPESPFAYIDVVRLKHGLIKSADKLAINIFWDKNKNSFVARIAEEDIEGYGETWVKAVGDLEQVWWISKSMRRLNAAIDDLIASIEEDYESADGPEL